MALLKNTHTAPLVVIDSSGAEVMLPPHLATNVEGEFGDDHLFVAARMIVVMDSPTDNAELLSARKEYEELTGKKAYNKKLETLQADIAKAKEASAASAADSDEEGAGQA